MSSETVTTRFCAAMLAVAREQLPEPLSRAARRTLLNILGTTVSASGAVATGIVLGMGGAGDEGRSVLSMYGTGRPYRIALATGTAAHLDDFDDTHLATVIHPGASALATVLALGPGHGASGAAFLGAFAAGCEAQLRIGNAISPAHYDRGWHITGTCGVLGAAIAASALLGLDPPAAARALSLAAVMTVGHREAFGSMTKPLHAGQAAVNGMLAAWLAGRGLAGPADPLGPGGVLETLAGGAGGVNRAALDQASWELELNTFKTYPCGVVAHPAMDAGVDAHPLIGDPSLITGVSVTCNPLVPELMGLRHPEDGLRSRFSARHGVAAGLRYGRAGLAEFSDAAARDPEMTRLREVIELAPDPGCARDAAVLRVSLSSGEPVTVRAEHTRGSIARPLTDDELLEKVSALVAPVLGPRAVTRIRAVVEGLPAAPDLTALLDAIRPAAAPPAATGPAPSPAPGPAPVAAAADRAPTTDVILALALASPALVDAVVVADQAEGEAKASLAAFRAAVESGAGTRVEQLIESAAEGGVLPEGHGLTAFASAAAALAAGPAAGAGSGAAVLAAETVIVCAAATATGHDCAEAVAIGLDVTELVATGLPDASGQGWSVPVIAATIGAAVAAGLMLSLPEPALRAAIGIAATQAAGLRSADGTDAFVVQAGKAAFNAVQAAHLAAAGFTSSAHPLEGRRGLYALFGG